MNSNNQTATVQDKLKLICDSSRNLLDLPKHLPALPEIITLFQREILRRQTACYGSPHSGDYHDNQQRIEQLQTRLQLLQALQAPEPISPIGPISPISPILPSPSAESAKSAVENSLPNPSLVDPQPLSAEAAPPQPRSAADSPPPQSQSAPAAPTPQPQSAPAAAPNQDSAPKTKPKNPGHDSPLDHLTPEQQELLDTTIDLNSTRTAAKTLSGPPPAGLGFPVSDSAIQRYKNRQERERLQARLEQAKADAKTLLETGDDTQLAAATQRLTRCRILSHFMSPHADIQTLIHYNLKAERLRLTELREHRLAQPKTPKETK